MNIPELTKKHLEAGKFLQVATSKDNRPWVCTVFYVSDDEYNVYWVSEESRRHSKELVENSHAAAAVNLKGRSEDPAIGLQMEGVVSIVEDDEQKNAVVKLFMDRNGSKQDWADKVLSGEGGRRIYKLAPSMFAVFDTQSIQGDPLVEWRLS
jgi:uncharacterized protein YhbP (UPF0306 family)